MSEASRREVRAGLEPCLARLWRYALTLSRASDVAKDLVQATCLRAIERADQFASGTRLDRWLFAILRSIWLIATSRAAFSCLSWPAFRRAFRRVRPASACPHLRAFARSAPPSSSCRPSLRPSFSRRSEPAFRRRAPPEAWLWRPCFGRSRPRTAPPPPASASRTGLPDVLLAPKSGARFLECVSRDQSSALPLCRRTLCRVSLPGRGSLLRRFRSACWRSRHRSGSADAATLMRGRMARQLPSPGAADFLAAAAFIALRDMLDLALLLVSARHGFSPRVDLTHSPRPWGTTAICAQRTAGFGKIEPEIASLRLPGRLSSQRVAVGIRAESARSASNVQDVLRRPSAFL